MVSHTPIPELYHAPSRFAKLFSTPVPDRAMEYMASLYRPHVLRVGRSTGFDMAFFGFELGGLHVGSIQYGTATSAQLEEGRDDWVFSWLRSGNVRNGCTGQRLSAGDASILAPDDALELQMSPDMELINLRVGQANLREACRSLLGIDIGPHIRFNDKIPAGSAAAQALKRITNVLATTPYYPSRAASHRDRSLREAVLYELLLALPGSHSRELQMPAVAPDTVRRAREYIHAHLHELPTISDVAAAAGVGVRALAKGFQRHLGTSPSQYALDLRLDRVREQLLQQPSFGGVTLAALEWGFAHQGQFAARYRRRFGELPSDTLRSTSSF